MFNSNEILIKKTEKRERFIEESFSWGKIFEKIKDKKKILLKPNIVSFEPYPTTTHPQTLKKCLELILKIKSKNEVLVGDGPAFDAGNSNKILAKSPLKEICDQFGVSFVNFNTYPKKKISYKGYTFLIARVAFEADFIISLPVLKSHRLCQMTGALKNQYGFLAPKQKIFYHLPLRNINKAIVFLNKIIKVDFFIVDAQKTLIFAQEKRHGGREAKLGWMLAGFSPLKLDIAGFKILQKIDLRLKNKKPEEIPQIAFAKKYFSE